MRVRYATCLSSRDTATKCAKFNQLSKSLFLLHRALYFVFFFLQDFFSTRGHLQLSKTLTLKPRPGAELLM